MKTAWWRKLHNEELHNLYSTPSVIRMVKSMRMKWEGHLALRRRRRRILQVIGGKTRRKGITRKTKTYVGE
jgi:hypothetical protein